MPKNFFKFLIFGFLIFLFLGYGNLADAQCSLGWWPQYCSWWETHCISTRWCEGNIACYGYSLCYYGYCSYPFTSAVDCDAYDYGDSFCEGDIARYQYYDYYCSGGSCSYTITVDSYTDCNVNNYYSCSGDWISYVDHTCSNGFCVLASETLVSNCNDRDHIACDGDWVVFYDYYCSGGSCAGPQTIYLQDCNDNDTYGPLYCEGNLVKQTFYDWYCLGNGCTFTTSDILVEDCDARDGWVDVGKAYYCCDGDLACICQDQEYRDWYCSGGSCTYIVTGTQTLKSNCQDCNLNDGCSNGYYRDYSCQNGVCALQDEYCTEECCDQYWNDSRAYCVDRDTCSAPVTNQAPSASFSCIPSNCTAYSGSPLTLRNDSTDPNGQSDIAKSAWDILYWGNTPDQLYSDDPNTPENEALQDYTIQTQILGPGTFRVDLTVEDRGDLSSSFVGEITILQPVVSEPTPTEAPAPPTWQEITPF